MTPVCPARDWATNNQQFSPVRREGPSFFGHENFITKDDFEDIYFLFYTFNVLIIGILSNKNRLITRRKCSSIPLVTRRFKSNYHFQPSSLCVHYGPLHHKSRWVSKLTFSFSCLAQKIRYPLKRTALLLLL